MSNEGGKIPGAITELLGRYRQGDKQAEERLIGEVYAELRKIAAAYLRRERPNHSLQASALVNEAYVKLAGLDRLDWQSRSHFFGVAAKLMREILVDHARARLAEKRGGGVRVVTLVEGLAFEKHNATDILALNEALEHLARKDPRTAKIVECRFFGGLSIDETAEALGVAPRTVKRDWQFGRAWLQRRLGKGTSVDD
jgi:RNA polymerase sigma factor (TIGR02999 family)